MAILSARARKKVLNTSLIVCVATLAWILQSTVLSLFSFSNAYCNLPLAITIVWGFVFGSDLPPIYVDELRAKTIQEIFLHQAASGSLSGFLLGAFFAAIYASVLPIYPICYPIIGWIAGYFSMKNLNPETLMCIPVVMLATVAAEVITACQLTLTGLNGSFSHLAEIALPSALLNALISPFVYYPIWHWHDFNKIDQF